MYVYVLEEIIPYDTGELLGVFGKLELAQAALGPVTWTEGGQKTDGPWWKAKKNSNGFATREYLISRWELKDGEA